MMCDKKRVSWVVVLASVLLTACGGGNALVGDGGITGTGVYKGRITNFGSIWVNGVRFEVNNATLTRDGDNTATQADFSIGEYVEISGSVDTSGTSGTAVAVQFNNELEGVVTAETLDNLTIEVLGQIIHTDNLTVLHGIATLADIKLGNVVEVSGVKNAAGETVATSITLKQTAFIPGTSKQEVSGAVTALDTAAQTFEMGKLLVDYSNASFSSGSAATLQNGLRVEAKSDSPLDGSTLIVQRIEFKKADPNYDSGTEIEVEGKITSYTSVLDFDVSGIQVTTNSQTRFEHGVAADLRLNRLVEVEGAMNSEGILVAEEVSFKESDTESGIELEGLVQSIDVAQSKIMLAGKTVVVDEHTIMDDESLTTFTLADLKVGDQVEVKGTLLASGEIRALKLER